MASYNASINLEVRIEKALSQIGKVEKALDRLSGIGSAGKEFKEALVPDTKKLGQLGKELDAIKNRANSTAKVFARLFEGIGTAGATAAGLEAVNAQMFELAQSTGTAAASIQAFDKNTGDLSRFIPGFTLLKDSVSASATEVNKLQYNLQQFLNNTEGLREFVQNFYTMEGAAGVATTGLLALAGVLEGQLRQSLGDIEQAGNKAFKGLQEDIVNNTSELNRLINATRGTADQYRNLIRLGEERRDSYNSSSREARQAINTIVRAEEKLTDELRAQADLRRAAKGVTVTELEATKGRKSIETKKSAEDFALKQLTEQERVYEAIARLNERDGTALQQKLNIQRNITNLATLEAQRAQEAQFQGQSMRIPKPYRTAGSLGFPVALPEIAQDRKLRAQEQSREAAKTALEQQKANSLLVQGVTSLRAQVAIAEQLNGVYDEIVRTLQVANNRQSQLFRATQNRQKRQELGGENLQRLERINKLSTNRVLQEQLKNKVALAGNAIRKNEFTTAKQIGKEIDELLKTEDQRIDRARRVVAFRKKERAELRKTRADRASRRKEALGSGIIGGAFPLLFGQGVGASVGGGLGGAAGGLMGGQFGFGLSLVGTAVGSAVDTFVKNMGDLANSLGDPAKALEALEQAGLKVDASVKTQVESLLKAGKAYEAQQLIFEQINNTLGPAAVGQLNAYQQQSEKLNSAYQEISSSIQREMLPALVGFVSMINTIVKVAKDLNLGGATKTGLLTNLAILNPSLLIGGFALQQTGTQAGKKAGENIPLSPAQQAIEAERVIKNKELEDSLRLQVELSNRKLAAARLNKKTDLDAWLVAQQQIIAQEYKIKNEEIYLRYKREGLSADVRSLLVQQNMNERAAKRAKLLQDYKNIQDDLNRSQAQADKRALADAKAIAKAIASAKINELNALKALFASSVALTRQRDGELAALEQRLKQLDTERNDQLKILEIRYEEQAQTSKSIEEHNKLYDIYTLQYKTVVNTYETEKLKTQELLNQLKVYGNLERLSATAGFQLSTELTGAFVPKGAEGILSPGAGLTDFMTGAELAPIIEQEAALARVLEKYQQIGEAAGIASQLATFGLRDMIEGTKSAEQVFADFLRNIADMLLQTAATMIAQYVAIGIARAFAIGGSGPSPSSFANMSNLNNTSFFNQGAGALGGLGGFGGGLSTGGPTAPNTTYLVGERGPELLTMGSQGGYVHSNQSSAMERYRNGGPAGTQTVNVSYSVTEINGMRFVTEDQFRAGMDQAAKRGANMGQARTLGTLKNSRAQRSRLGL